MQSISGFMEKDHDRLDDLFNKYKDLKNSDPNKSEEIFSEFKSGLEKHILWEEDILFPLFEKKTAMYGSGPTSVMRLEHKNIKSILDEISGKLTGGSTNTDDFENTLVAFLSHHNHKEENILYPMIDNSVNDEELSELFVKMNELSSGD